MTMHEFFSNAKIRFIHKPKYKTYISVFSTCGWLSNRFFKLYFNIFVCPQTFWHHLITNHGFSSQFCDAKNLAFFFQNISKISHACTKKKKIPDFFDFLGQKMANFIGEKTLHRYLIWLIEFTYSIVHKTKFFFSLF
jgi:hypothetical protein